MKKIKTCATCKFKNVRSKQHPCNICNQQASGAVTNMWKGYNKFGELQAASTVSELKEWIREYMC